MKDVSLMLPASCSAGLLLWVCRRGEEQSAWCKVGATPGHIGINGSFYKVPVSLTSDLRRWW